MASARLLVKAACGDSNAQRFVVVKSSGGEGLGDRLRTLAIGLLLAKITDRTLWVDWRDRAYGLQSGNIFPELFSLAGVAQVEKCPCVDTVYPEVWKGSLALSQDEVRANDLHSRGVVWTGAAPPWDPLDAMRRYSWDFADISSEADALVIASMNCAELALDAFKRAGVIPQESLTWLVLSQCLRDHLRVNRVVSKNVIDFIEANDWKGQFVRGIHVRWTNESNAARTMPSLKQYFNALERADRNEAADKIFVSTDNISVLEEFERRLGRARVLACSKWFAPSGESLHKNINCPDPVQAAREAVVDLALLASCDSLVSTGNSSFSIIANSLSSALFRRRIVLYPRSPFYDRLLKKVRGVLRTLGH